MFEIIAKRLLICKIMSFKIKNCLVVIPCVSSYYDIKNRISNRKQKDVIYFDIQQY